MAIYKYKRINASVDKDKTTVNNNDTAFYTEDKNTASLQLFITWNNKPFDLNNTSMKPVLDLFHQDQSIWIDEPLDVIDAGTGVLQYTIPEKVIKHAGNVSAKLFLKNEKESVHVANFGFVIKDSGVESAVEKEISVNLVEDSVKKIVKENAIDLLGDNFKSEVFNSFQTYVTENVEEFKGPKGDTGERGPKGMDGLRGPKGNTGEKGDQGERGPQGVRGEKGDQGERGEQGPQGLPGNDGEIGEQGPKGERGERGPKGDPAGQSYYTSVSDLGAIGNGTDLNTELFNKLSPSKTYYVPSGTFKTEVIPEGYFFGEGQIRYWNEDIPLSKSVPQKVKVNMNKTIAERYQNFIVGQNAGKSLNDSTYAITGVGYNVLKTSETGRRLTAVGKGAMSNLKGGYSSVAYGADALGQGTYSQRNVAIGDNALKWGGVTDAIATLHDYWLTTGSDNFINANFLSKYPNVWSHLGSESKPATELYPTSDEDYVENVAVGRNALLHQMKGSFNTAVGYNSQAHTMTGIQNTSVGNRTLRDNIAGTQNSAFGNESLSNNITGTYNTAAGANALQLTLHGGYNSAFGYGAMRNFLDDKNKNTEDTNKNGVRNTAIGVQSMQDGKNASYSTFVGTYSGQNVQSNYNVGIGAAAMQDLTTGQSNVGLGSYANRAVVTGNNNVAIGYSAGPGADYSNTVSLGYNVHAKGNNQIQIGDASHTVYTASAIQTNSDRNLKNNINNTKLGLDFIKNLRPVDYFYNGSDTQRHGFIAQEVVENESFGGVEKNNDGTYTMAYSELIAPMVKAIQDQQETIENLQKEIEKLKR